MKKIDPIILKGTRDFLPEELIKRNFVMNRIREIFERFGYSPIETPIICPAETILGKYGEEGEKLTYSFDDNGGRRIALPYDLTVPFARFFAANWGKLPIPFKRYQIQKVWRADKPQKGRYREFYQCDIDIIGSKSLICEAEIAKVVITVFKELGFRNFEIKINSRKFLNDIIARFNISEDVKNKAIQTIDKLAKIGEKDVKAILKELGAKDVDKLMGMLTFGGTNAQKLKEFADFNIEEIKEFLAICKDLGIEDKYLKFDPSLARGLDYYTGINFEVVSKEMDFGSLCGGGRYDNLCEMFSNQDFSGVGISFGFDRICLALEEMGKLKSNSNGSQALIAIFDEDTRKEALENYSELVDSGISAEVYFEPGKLAKQYKYADTKGIPFVIVCGPDEIKEKSVQIKNMKTGKQKLIPKNQLVSYLKNYYEA